VEQVLDPRTRMILFKMISQGHIYEVNGCISTGKEANVYHAKTESGEDRAIKVYKTSILIFKDRDRYVSGEFRFRHGYSKHNPRQMVKVWAEKEMRNLKRLQMAGIPCPAPLLLRQHVLLMTFLGKEGWAAPRLKDSELSDERTQEAYHQLVKVMRTMYHQCRLVHADLSEYNLLYHKGMVYVIDVSQSVEHDHPHSLDFLRKDCTNVTDFFTKKGIIPMSVRQLFDFVTSLQIPEDRVDEYLENIQREIGLQPADEASTTAAKQEDEVFKKSYIPRNLFEVIDIERDIAKLETGDTKELLYTNLTGLQVGGKTPEASPGPKGKAEGAPKEKQPAEKPPKQAAPKAASTQEKEEKSNPGGENDDDNEDEGDDDDDDDESEGDGDSEEGEEGLTAEEAKAQKKARKKAVKEENREKRKAKMPKHVKKRKEKTTTTKGKK